MANIKGMVATLTTELPK